MVEEETEGRMGLGLALLGSIFPADCVGRRGAQLARVVGDLGLHGGLRPGIKPSTTAHQSAGQQAHKWSHIDYIPICLRSQPYRYYSIVTESP